MKVWRPSLRFRSKPAGVAQAARAAGSGSAPLRIETPEQLGAEIFGPVLFAFMVWLMRHPAIARLDRIYFSSREGWALEKLYSTLRQDAGYWHLPRGIYLHASRRASLAARMGAEVARTGRFDARLLTSSSPWFAGSVDALLHARIGFVPRAAGAADAAPIMLMRDAETVHCVADLLREEITPHVRHAYTGFAAYARARDLLSGGHAGLVDVGYSATIQLAIQKTLGIELVGFYMAATEAASRVAEDGGYAFGAFANGTQAAGFGGAFGLCLEAVLTAPHGQVKGYTAGTGKRSLFRAGAGEAGGEPLFDRGGVAQAGFGVLERIHAGIEAYSLERLRAKGLVAEADPFVMLRRLVEGGIDLAEPISSAMSVEDAFCGNGEIGLRRQMSQT